MNSIAVVSLPSFETASKEKRLLRMKEKGGNHALGLEPW